MGFQRTPEALLAFARSRVKAHRN